MRKRVFRYFISLEKQENWLNLMAAKGWRLVKTDSFTYTLEACKPSSYVYRVEFVGGKTQKELDDYRQFLHEHQIVFFSKGMNLGKFSYGSKRWRPYGRKGGVFASAPGTINSEILIMERDNSAGEFQIYSDDESKINYYSTVRNVYLVVSLLLALTFFLSTPTPSQIIQDYLLYKTWDYRWIYKTIHLLILLLLLGNLWRVSKRLFELKRRS